MQYEHNIFGENLTPDEEEMPLESRSFDETATSLELNTMEKRRVNRYKQIIEHIFMNKYEKDALKIPFVREEMNQAADTLNLPRVKNLGDLNYYFRYRNTFPASISSTAPEGLAWIIRPSGKGLYSFELIEEELANIKPQRSLVETKVPDATPGLVALYAKGDEQALLTRLRYNRLIDIFTGVTCYSLQNHLRTTVPGMGQVETDEIYIGIDKKGAHFVFPLQAKGGSDILGIVQIEQDFALCTHKFPGYVQCRPIAAQFMEDNLIALFEFENTEKGLRKVNERHYRLVSPEKMTAEDLRAYMLRPD